MVYLGSYCWNFILFIGSYMCTVSTVKRLFFKESGKDCFMLSYTNKKFCNLILSASIRILHSLKIGPAVEVYNS